MRVEDRDRVGVCLGTALGGVGFAEEQYPAFLAHGPRGVNPMLALSVFNGAGSCNIAIELGVTGPVTANGDSCASSPIAIGRAIDLIRDGSADLMLAGGSEAPLSPLCYGAFAIIRAMSQRNDDPQTASRPFDKDRDGFVMAEGAAMLLLEELSHAQARGARIYGEIVSHACTNDAFHMTQPRPDGVAGRPLHDIGPRTRPSRALTRSATSTPMRPAPRSMTARKRSALKQTFGEACLHHSDQRHERLSRSRPRRDRSVGSGDLPALPPRRLAAADAEPYQSRTPPATSAYLRDPAGRTAHVDHVLSNSFGFGGINACLVFGRV